MNGVKPKLGQGDLANFLVNNIIETFWNNGFGDTPEVQGQEALDNYFGMLRGKAEAIQGHNT